MQKIENQLQELFGYEVSVISLSKTAKKAHVKELNLNHMTKLVKMKENGLISNVTAKRSGTGITLVFTV